MKILTADDDVFTRNLLNSVLAAYGHEVVVCQNGDEVRSHLLVGTLPQLVILDWMMPGLTGPELCNLIRNKPELPYTHVIMLTSKTGRDDILVALRSGANDYLTKPLNEVELRNRINIASTVINLNNTIVSQRHQIEHASRLALLGQMAGNLAHEINNPLSIIKTRVELIEFASNDKSEKAISGYAAINRSISRITKIIDTLRDMSSESSDNDIQTTSIETVIDYALELIREKFVKYGVALKFEYRHSSPLKVQKRSLAQLFLTLFQYSFVALKGRAIPFIEIQTEETASHIIVSICDNGAAIPFEVRRNILTPNFFSNDLEKISGFGIAAIRGIIEAHGGNIQVDTNSPFSKILISLPKSSEKASA